MLKTLYKTVGVVFLLVLTVLEGQSLTATGTGYGLTKDAATEQAKRDAV